MKYVIVVNVFLLVFANALASTSYAQFVKRRSLVSDAAKEFGIRSIDTHAVLPNERRLHQLLPRSEDDFKTIHRRSGRGGAQNPPRGRIRSLSPERAEVTIMGKGPAKVVGTHDDGRMRNYPAVPPGELFQVDAVGRRNAAGHVKALESTRTGLKGVVAVTAVGKKSAKVNVNTQEGLGKIQRISPPPQDERFVAPFREDSEEIVANPAPRKQELMATMGGRGEIVAEAKAPDTRAS